ncbi:hypothetical protein ACWY7G_004550 [Enterobacter hormaechei]|uniref:Uncharacterized protein n=1 Tax=Enterobacter hormaechei TaxID=158836 RepID=A0A927DJA6_9ENTR|nr:MULTISPECIES: hypothetical protein [Enterobacter cloacae complex]EJK8935817.1 hypothetical protein [Enterobacter hormaechei]EJK8939211.1 hypothetical protein [Enterobacter hormaechei]EKS6613023.1 hypothetical protein [Enterobacter hormaechei]EKU3255317.1 hypothetical protein [Enterobacter hormaechei]EKV5716097.1 hypothetical protein [Enterobacter hormaechei]
MRTQEEIEDLISNISYSQQAGMRYAPKGLEENRVKLEIYRHRHEGDVVCAVELELWEHEECSVFTTYFDGLPAAMAYYRDCIASIESSL